VVDDRCDFSLPEPDRTSKHQREASANITQYGIVVQHPRTGNPIENPYLVIRDRAAKKLLAMRKIKADFLW
jgi:hypothetical protein